MTADDRLKQALGLEPAPSRPDYVFTARVMQAVARRRFFLGLANLGLWAVAAAMVIWALRPVIASAAPVLEAGAGLIGLALGVGLAAILLGRLGPEGLVRLTRRALARPGWR